MTRFCKATVDKKGNIKFTGAQTTTSYITAVIEDDKKYGKFVPKTGNYFTYRVLSDDVEISIPEIERAIQKAQRQVSVRTNLKFRKALPGEEADFKIDFRTVESDVDKQLTANTLMYHYFPINGDSPLRGLCVVNKAFYWTADGKGVDMYKIDPIHYKPNSGVMGATHDFDQVYTHELLHGLGLPHSKLTGVVMSSNYGIMAEFLQEEDIARLQAKYGKRVMKDHILKRWLNWIFTASER